MNIVFFAHPSFMASQSMPRYAQWLAEGMKRRGHNVTVWKPQAKCYNWPIPGSLKKWMGYIDQYVLFPRYVRQRKRELPANTLFVFTDHALGPWVPLVSEFPHVIHCHDFLAQRSALGEIPEVSISFSGRRYQAYIRRGYQQGKNFISISEKTRNDLHKLLKKQPAMSEMVYNGLTQEFSQAADTLQTRNELSGETSISLNDGFFLHVGGNQWYKNRTGVIKIYNAWRQLSPVNKLPLLMIGSEPVESLKAARAASPFKGDIHFLTGKSDEFVKKAYAAATLFIFPSLDEGFGWPLIEAMAAGCPVVTTDAPPMNEVGADAVIYIKRKPLADKEANVWAADSAKKIDEFLSDKNYSDKLRQYAAKNIQRFDSSEALNKIEIIYKRILQ